MTVVLPASIWAMIPMFRVLASGSCRRHGFSSSWIYHLKWLKAGSPRHLVRVFAPLDRRAEAIHGIDELRREFFTHALAVALAGRLDEPADTERHAAVTPDLDRDLIRCATDAARLDFDDGRRILDASL